MKHNFHNGEFKNTSFILKSQKEGKMYYFTAWHRFPPREQGVMFGRKYEDEALWA